jgi:membrane associated rhomboid family serine protease
MCPDCLRASLPSAGVRLRQWNAAQHMFVTRLLIAVNAGIFLWTLLGGVSGILSGSNINRRQFDLALSSVFIENGEWWRLATAGFLHFGVFHIAMNMLLLFQLGQLLETGIGRTRFALLYTTSLLGGSLGALLLSPNALTGGASGAVFGLMAAATVGLRQRGINPFQTGIGATLVLNLIITFAIPGVSIGGHLGGAIVGGAVGYVMLEPRWNRNTPSLAIAAPIITSVLCVAVALSLV